MGIRLVAAMAFGASALVASVAGAADAPPVASVVELKQEAASAQLSFELSQPIEATARPIVAPDRIVVDIPEVDFQIDPAQGRLAAPPSAIVNGFRFGLLAPGKSRVVIDLNRPACIAKLQTAPGGAGALARLTLALTPCDAKSFAALAATGAAIRSSAPAPAEAAAAPVVVLDPGHGGEDGGAQGGQGGHSVLEKTIVFEYALELKRQIEATHRFKVVMTRESDKYVSLEDRVAIARDADAALMISIHADTLPGSSAEVSGTTVYTCSERASDAEAARIAERENAADRAADARVAADAGVADILFDLKRRETRAYAHLFSRGLVGQLGSVARLNHHPERSAGFVVLKAPDFPSVLIELGYLSNPQDVANLSSPDWRARGATATVAAIEKFFEASSIGGAATATTPEAIAASDKAAAH